MPISSGFDLLATSKVHLAMPRAKSFGKKKKRRVSPASTIEVNNAESREEEQAQEGEAEEGGESGSSSGEGDESGAEDNFPFVSVDDDHTFDLIIRLLEGDIFEELMGEVKGELRRSRDRFCKYAAMTTAALWVWRQVGGVDGDGSYWERAYKQAHAELESCVVAENGDVLSVFLVCEECKCDVCDCECTRTCGCGETVASWSWNSRGGTCNCKPREDWARLVPGGRVPGWVW